MISILFLIRSLERGGAERQLIELVKGLDKTRFRVAVVTFYDGGSLRPELERVPDIEVFSLHKASRWDLIAILPRLYRLTRTFNPRVIHGYMGVANHLAVPLGKLVGARVVWGVRASTMDASEYDWTFTWLSRLSIFLARYPDVIMVNSTAAKETIVRETAAQRVVMVPNGIDTDTHRRMCEAGRRVRSEWGIAPNVQLVGLVARLEPMKDHPTFLRAAAELHGERSDVRFVCVGDGPAVYADKMRELAGSLGLSSTLRWAGARTDMPAVYSALDVAVSSSCYGEGFSNATAEAMACEVPCVVTDVGESAAIVGDRRQVVPIKDSGALASAVGRLLGMPKEERVASGDRARDRVVREFGVMKLVTRTEEILESFP
ncbi:MAG: glycosyltransferase [Chloroflexota bacterium]|nr:MAG: group 1 glycosyl transferase [Chloroflexota bacterium]